MSQLAERFKKWLGDLNPRERRLVIAGMIFLGVFLPYQLIWVPFHAGLGDLEEKLIKQQSDLDSVKKLAAEARQLQAGSGVQVGAISQQSLLTVVVNSASRFLKQGIENTKEEGETVRVRLKDASFDELMRWLDNLQTRHATQVREVALERQTTAGRVSGKVVLER